MNVPQAELVNNRFWNRNKVNQQIGVYYRECDRPIWFQLNEVNFLQRLQNFEVDPETGKHRIEEMLLDAVNLHGSEVINFFCVVLGTRI